MLLHSSNLSMRYLLIISTVALFTSCYSFKGISISPEIKTFFVEDFSIAGTISPPADAAQIFSEDLRAKIRNESRLNYQEVDPDIVFSGTISRYSVDAVAPVEGGRSDINRLQIAVNIEMVDNIKEDESWRQSFSFFSDFDATTDLQSVESDLIETIYEQLIEDVFNKAFTNW